MNIIMFIFFIILSLSFMMAVNDESNFSWWKKNKNKNFQFKWKGRTLWYSRSVAVALFTYCKNELGEWCVLANKRGEGTPDYQGYWNCVCGYLDHNENSMQAAQRECKEETGLNIPIEVINVVNVNSDPSNNRQNVTIRHSAILDGTTEKWNDLSKKYMEKGEVDDIQWIPISKINEYKWAFGHDKLILEFVPKES